MGWYKEFKQFVARGNAVDMAVGVIIGAAFGKIVTSLVNDIMMPPIGKLTGDVNFSDIFINLDRVKTGHIASLAQAKQAGAAVIAVGQFLNNVIDFVMVSAAVFVMLKGINALRRPEPAPAPATKECPYCVSSIPLKASRCPSCTSQLG